MEYRPRVHILITGASSGIGAAVAAEYLARDSTSRWAARLKEIP